VLQEILDTSPSFSLIFITLSPIFSPEISGSPLKNTTTTFSALEHPLFSTKAEICISSVSIGFALLRLIELEFTLI